MRKRKSNQQVCNCEAYHFPHRYGSGKCGHPERIDIEWLDAMYPKLTPEQREAVIAGNADPEDFDDIPFEQAC